jgi:hypothetical protein
MVLALALLAVSVQNPLKSQSVFPVAVWLQEPSLASRYKAAGFNLFVGLWQGPTEEQLSKLKAAGMPVVCEQNAVGLNHKSDPIIAAWMHQDEPDNAQPAKDAAGKPTWGPCVPPTDIVAKYKAMKAADPTRPVMLNLGQGIANDAWIGRGNGSKLDDYKTYVLGGDIVSFDIYPIAGLQDSAKIPLIAKGLDRLHSWAPPRKRIWNCLECTSISGKGKPTPDQLRCEAWLSIVHGSTGLIYFVHQFEPKFNEHALLDDPEMLRAATRVNAEIQRHAAILLKGATISASGHVLIKRLGAQTYVFAVNPGSEPVVITLPGVDRAVDSETGVSEGASHPLQISVAPFGVRILQGVAGH